MLCLHYINAPVFFLSLKVSIGPFVSSLLCFKTFHILEFNTFALSKPSTHLRPSAYSYSSLLQILVGSKVLCAE